MQWDWRADTAGEWASGFSRADIRAAYERAELRVVSVDVGFLFSFDGQEMEALQGVGQR